MKLFSVRVPGPRGTCILLYRLCLSLYHFQRFSGKSRNHSLMVYPGMSQEIQEAILRELAMQVVAIRGTPEDVETLVRTPLKLYNYVLKTPVNWRKIATALGQDRNRIYHWYRETHSRNILNVKMTNEDREAIRSLIIRGVRDHHILALDFYQEIHARFGAKYPRQELRMTYNNALRTHSVRVVLDEYGIQIPSKRSHAQRARRTGGRAKQTERKCAPVEPVSKPLPLNQLSGAVVPVQESSVIPFFFGQQPAGFPQSPQNLVSIPYQTLSIHALPGQPPFAYIPFIVTQQGPANNNYVNQQQPTFFFQGN